MMMTRRVLLIGVLASVGAFGADPLPSAESLLDRYIQVTGGRDAYESRKSQIMWGTIVYPAQGIQGPFVRYEANGMIYTFVEMAGVSVESGVKGGVGWERSNATGPRIMGSGERAQALRERFDSLYRWRESYTKVETTGEETVNGQPCYRVVLTPVAGYPETVFLSKKDGWPVKVSAIYQTQMGALPGEVVVSNYKNFGGMMVPAKTSNKIGNAAFTMTIDSVEVNTAIDPNRFNLPADVLALANRRSK